MIRNLSNIGEKMSRLSGVRLIVKDIQETVRSGKVRINASVGQPRIPEIEQKWLEVYQEVLASDEIESTMHVYGKDKGVDTIEYTLARLIGQYHACEILPEHIFLSASTQQLYFNAVMNYCGDGSKGRKKLLLPLLPDYTGYGGVVTDDSLVIGIPGKITIDQQKYQYSLDIPAIKDAVSEAGLMIISQPTNPTGNMLSTEDVYALQHIAEEAHVPLIIDSAYAPPIPNMVYSEYPQIDMGKVTDGYTILGYSLSKAGMAGERFGWAVGATELLAPLQSYTANTMIHPPKLIQAVANSMFDQNKSHIDEISSTIHDQFNEKRDSFISHFNEICGDVDIYVHEIQGGLFAWLWIPGIDDLKLYEHLKSKGIIIVPGRYFFPGCNGVFETHTNHSHECVRISLSCKKDDIPEILHEIKEFIKHI